MTIQRTDLLFTEIFQRFKESQRTEIFCELLVPYILNGKLSVVSPEVLGDFVQYYQKQGKLMIVEQCIMHLDVTMLDFDSVIRHCRGHGLHSALIYVCNRGLNDYITPMEVMLNTIASEENSRALQSQSEDRGSSSIKGRDFSSLHTNLGSTGLGYKLLYYLKLSLAGQSFPFGQNLEPEVADKVRASMIRWIIGHPGEALLPMAKIDTGIFMGVISDLLESDAKWMDDDPNQFDPSSYTTLSDDLPQKQIVVDAIFSTVLPGTKDDDAGGVSPISKTALGIVYAFLAKHASMGQIRIRGALLDQTLRFLVLGPVSTGEGVLLPTQGRSWEDRQKQLVKLLQRLCASALWGNPQTSHLNYYRW